MSGLDDLRAMNDAERLADYFVHEAQRGHLYCGDDCLKCAAERNVAFLTKLIANRSESDAMTGPPTEAPPCLHSRGGG